MKQILVLSSKHNTVYYDASTPELEKVAYLKAFKFNDEFTVYTDLDPKHSELKDFKKELDELKKAFPKLPKSLKESTKEQISELESRISELETQTELYLKAKKGDVEAIKELMELRKDYEYEGISIESVE